MPLPSKCSPNKANIIMQYTWSKRRAKVKGAKNSCLCGTRLPYFKRRLKKKRGSNIWLDSLQHKSLIYPISLLTVIPQE